MDTKRDWLDHPDKLRFAVGEENGPRSAWWFIHPQPKGDVYLGAVSLGGWLKISLHKDGNCHLGLEPKQLAAMQRDGLPQLPHRHLFRWRRKETPQSGSTLAASIFIPSEFLDRSPPQAVPPRFKVLFAPPPAGMAVELMLVYSRGDPAKLESEYSRVGKPLLYSTFPNGETASIIVRVVPFDPAPIRGQLAQPGRPQPLSRAIENLPIGSQLTGLSGMFFNEPSETGVLQLVDVSGITFTRTS